MSTAAAPALVIGSLLIIGCSTPADAERGERAGVDTRAPLVSSPPANAQAAAGGTAVAVPSAQKYQQLNQTAERLRPEALARLNTLSNCIQRTKGRDAQLECVAATTTAVNNYYGAELALYDEWDRIDADVIKDMDTRIAEARVRRQTEQAAHARREAPDFVDIYAKMKGEIDKSIAEEEGSRKPDQGRLQGLRKMQESYNTSIHNLRTAYDDSRSTGAFTEETIKNFTQAKAQVESRRLLNRSIRATHEVKLSIATSMLAWKESEIERDHMGSAPPPGRTPLDPLKAAGISVPRQEARPQTSVPSVATYESVRHCREQNPAMTDDECAAIVKPSSGDTRPRIRYESVEACQAKNPAMTVSQCQRLVERTP